MKIRSSASALTSLAGTLLALAGFFLVFGASTASAQAVAHEITWAHTAPADVARFVVYVSRVEGDLSQARQIDVGKPTGQPTGGALTSFSAVVLADADDFVAVGAMSANGVASPPSQWAALPPSKPGQPLLLP